jgi:AraC-like DNA-binding protein
MTRIFIENYEVDISKGLSNSITYAIDDLQNLDSKSTAFSKTIILPGTSNNNNILGNIFDVSNSNFTIDGQTNVGYNFNASKSAKCRIEVDGLQIIKGVFRLTEIIIDGKLIEYECAVFGELGGFFSKLSNSKLEDLDFSEYDLVYSAANIVASWDNANTGEGLYFPLIDYGNVSTNKIDFQYTAFRPALFIREYLSKIITAAGYTFQSTFFDTAFFKRLGITPNSKNLESENDTNYVNASTTTTQSGFGFSYTFPTHSLTNFTTSNDRDFVNAGVSTVNTRVKVALAGTYTQQGGSHIFISLRKNGLVIGTALTFPNATSKAFSTTIETTESIDVGDYISVEVTVTITAFSTQAMSLTSATLTIDKDPPGFTELLLGDNLIINKQIPKGILQKDFFASILKMFNLMVTEDKYVEKKLIIEPYVDFYDTDRTSYLDWSDKLDRSQVIRIKPMSELSSRYYEFIYKTDSDYYNDLYKKKYNEGYGDRKFDSVYEFAKETQKVDIIFSSSPLYGLAGTDKVYPAIYKLSNSVEDSMAHNIRIFQFKKIIGVTSWKIKNGVADINTGTSYGYAGHFDDPDAPNADINFGATNELYFTLAAGNLTNNLFNVYYSPYMAEITDKDSRLLTANFRLTTQDIYDLDFSKFVFIDGSLYRITKVIDYNTDGQNLTKCELLRVIYTTY